MRANSRAALNRNAFHMRPDLPPEDGLFEVGPPDFTRRPWTTRRIAPETLGMWAVRWHYSGNGGPTPAAYGAFGPDLAVVVGLAQSSSKDGLRARLGLTSRPGNLEISRVVAHPDAPANSVSYALGLCMRVWRAEGIEWVFTYADTGQGHHGGIYQAVNAIYVGATKARPGFTLDGRVVAQRTIGRMFGGQGPDALARARAAGHRIERVPGVMTPKHTYVIPCGSRASRRDIRRILEPHRLPYPKGTG